MNAFLKRLSPSATDMIRADHTRVLAGFHRYAAAARLSTKRGRVETLCLALEIHAAIEEEIFYPAVRAVDPSLVEKSIPEHEEMRRAIAELRSSHPGSPQYDRIFLELMRDIIHHVADEETMILPLAERLFPDRLQELGARMMARRSEIARSKIGEIAVNRARAHPIGLLLAAASSRAWAQSAWRDFVRPVDRKTVIAPGRSWTIPTGSPKSAGCLPSCISLARRAGASRSSFRFLRG
jgi:hemerythrin superfamily protein